MPEKVCGVIGATSLVGEAILPRLIDSGYAVAAFSRQKQICQSLNLQSGSVVWNPKGVEISLWVSLAPIMSLDEFLPLMESRGARKVVVLSTTSLFTKVGSKNTKEHFLVNEIKGSENTLARWADLHHIDWVVLRPTLIYGFGKDKNICEIARMIERFGFFPILGEGRGLRQPVHADDVAQVCQAALDRDEVKRCAYNIAGAERLTYREMVGRVFHCLEKKQRLITIPRWVFQLALLALKRFNRFSSWSVDMVDRMNEDMIFDYHEATRDLDFMPRPFHPEKQDLP